jgi:hypothetical protein
MLTPRSARTALACLAVIEGAAAVRRHTRRSEQFAAAKAHARRVGKPLVVIGDPDAGLHTRLYRAYGCGDLCVDLANCPKCSRSAAVDLCRRRMPLPNNSAIVFVGCTLEYVAEMEPAWQELRRVSGGPHQIYIATVQPWCLTAWLYPGARRVVHECGGSREIRTGEKAAVLGTLGYLAYAAL